MRTTGQPFMHSCRHFLGLHCRWTKREGGGVRPVSSRRLQKELSAPPPPAAARSAPTPMPREKNQSAVPAHSSRPCASRAHLVLADNRNAVIRVGLAHPDRRRSKKKRARRRRAAGRARERAARRRRRKRGRAVRIGAQRRRRRARARRERPRGRVVAAAEIFAARTRRARAQPPPPGRSARVTVRPPELLPAPPRARAPGEPISRLPSRA